MKKYKPMYGATLLIFMEKMFIGTLPIIFILAYVISKAERYSFWELIILILAAMILGVILFSVWLFIINLLIRAGIKENIELSDDEINYNGQKLSLHKIRFITLRLPKMERRTSCPQELVLWIDSELYINITRPSLLLVYKLKKECKNARFIIEGLKSEIIESLVIGIILFIIIGISLLISK